MGDSDRTRTDRTRAAALPVEERRSRIVQAVLPLFLDGGTAITTREIAQAAGIAEGTIFRAFANKTELVEAIVDAAFDPAVTIAALRAIDPALALEARLVAAVDVLKQRVETVFKVLSAVAALPNTVRPNIGPHGSPPDLSALVELLASDADRFTLPVVEVAHLLRALTFSCTHPSFVLEPLESREIVALFLDGVRAPDPTPDRVLQESPSLP
jgi:AcrR family transcriptional regulator